MISVGFATTFVFLGGGLIKGITVQVHEGDYTFTTRFFLVREAYPPARTRATEWLRLGK